jgi:hypothetical protein
MRHDELAHELESMDPSEKITGKAFEKMEVAMKYINLIIKL